MGALALLGTPVASAQTEATELCTIPYPNANVFEIPASSRVEVSPAGPGTIDVDIHTKANSLIGYDQRIGVVWANLDTGRSGVAETNARVRGFDTLLEIDGLTTEPGTIAFVFSASNHGWGDNYTYGDCSAEYTVS
ncbi:hypothetical protein DW322_04710 [Rhodococcus rhodnii]|uniref:Uncharacterized protein n=2 Tax=Rhodococcus rhodnii TaxID=38312 RepID=R7WNZ7_9NOCA|nr:hypothetical protein Rrhod_2981 [Rhodococcus rhodnii LMG 5362]TXG89650.1 hypothetical protein DW322_04710 [Rhodococcus rhodnii]